MEYSVELENIRKLYSSVVANDDISIKVRKGSVTCIVGENGAGKSTLMNILYGLEQPTSGSIKINGEPVSFASSRDAIKKKIGMVHQHFMLVNELSVLENVIIGMEPRKGLSLHYKKARAVVEELGERFGMRVPLDEKAGDLAVGVQQKVEILKILYRGAEILIFDEPTAVLTPQETRELFANIRTLTADGKTVILITHHLDEVMEISDDIVVVRRGKVVATLKKDETDVKQLAYHMVGSALPEECQRSESAGNETVLAVRDITVAGINKPNAVNRLSLEVRKGEILGIAGVSGNGQSELARALAGLVPVRSGSISLLGEDITKYSRRERLIEGISYIPEDRKTDGLCLSWSIAENAIAGYYILPQYSNKLGFINKKAMNETAARIIRDYDVRTPDALAPVGSLSGGNQQKVVIGRETVVDPKLIIAAEPTRGVDIGAVSFIHNDIIELRNKGVSVLLISSDLDEIFRLSDRIAVIYNGEIAAVVDPSEVTREELGLYMAGSKRREDA